MIFQNLKSFKILNGREKQPGVNETTRSLVVAYKIAQDIREPTYSEDGM